MMLKRTAKSCGSGAPGLASSLREEAQATVTTKPGHRGEREVSRKAIARGMPGETGVTVVTNSCVCFFTHEAAGALGIRHSLRPLFSERAKQFCKTRARRAARSRCFIRKQRCLKIESARARKRVTFPLAERHRPPSRRCEQLAAVWLDVLQCNARGLRRQNMLPASSKMKRLSCSLC